MLPNEIKYAPHSAHEVEFKGVSGEALRLVGIGITFVLVVSLNATPEGSKAILESIIPSNVRLGNNGFTDLDGVTIYEVIVENYGGTITQTA